jgi:hypothetical protein
LEILNITVILENWMGILYYNKYLESTNQIHVVYVRDEPGLLLERMMNL